MRGLLGSVCLVVTMVLAWALETTAAPAEGWRHFRGAFFDLTYPAGFKVVPREPNLGTTSGELDGVSFLSPDGQVEFYVFSPQWDGRPTWHQKRPGEKCLSYRQQRKGTRTVTWITYQGPGKTYERALSDTHDTGLNCRLIFGYKYRNATAYQTYRAEYLRFKASLVQYAD